MHPSQIVPEKLLRDCRVTRTRRSGEGRPKAERTMAGRTVIRWETAVVIEHIPSGIVAEANERRSQSENFQEAVFRLRVKLALEVRATIQSGETPSVLWESRSRGGHVSVNPEHSDFPALLAEAMGFLDACAMDVKVAAERLAVSTSQLVKFLKLAPPALSSVNERRKALGLRPLL
jgi:hypothetical protein